jgi:hypothetical protein
MIKLNDDILCCPKCSEPFLHQEKVDVCFRDGEDMDGTLVSTSTKKTEISRLTDKEIEGRRDVVYIEFFCEICQNENMPYTLKILQHKGNTFIEWDIRTELEVMS